MKQKYIFPFFVLFGFLASIVFGIPNDVLAQEAASFPISLEEASRRAVEYTRLGAPFSPSSQLTYDSKSAPWYVVDFLRFSDSPQGWFWRMRVVIDPHTGALVTDERVLKELFAEEGAIPPGIDENTKEVLLGISIKDAERRAAEQTQLGPEFSVFRTRLVYDSQNLPWYVIDFVKYDTYAKKVLWGRRVVVIGNPRGLAHTVSDGIVSARRVVEGGELIQITAPVSPGSSGGPVFNSKGEVIGIAKMIILESQNLNFVIPSNSINVLLANPGEIPMSALQQEEGKDKTE